MSRLVSTRHKARESTVMLAHGGGGQLTDELLQELVLPRLGNSVLNELMDSGVLDLPAGRLALTIDGYVVQPARFPGGDIGRIAISGTVNDLAVSGAVPHAIALSLILEEGLDRALLGEILESIRVAAAEANVRVVTGDTKVVGRGQADGLYITTAGVGVIPPGRRVHPDRIEAGDLILINGSIGDHGMTVMLAREMPHVQSVLRSDVAPLQSLIAPLLEALGDDVHFMRDPTRGGLACVVTDLAQRTGWHVELDEPEILVRPETLHAAEMLGLDPLEVANEGKVVMVVRAAAAPRALEVLKKHPLGRDARVIGRIGEPKDGLCELQTLIGGHRIMQKPYGEQLPRIC